MGLWFSLRALALFLALFLVVYFWWSISGGLFLVLFLVYFWVLFLALQVRSGWQKDQG